MTDREISSGLFKTATTSFSFVLYMFLFQIRSEEELGFVRIIMTALNIIAIYL
jgi:hypothetical protein